MPPPAEAAAPAPSRKRAHHQSSAASSSTATPPALEQEDFAAYVNFKILDTIGYPGAYRKFLLKRKDQGAGFAVKMNGHINSVQAGVKALSLLEQDIKSSHALKNLHMIWQHVVESNTPPSDLQLTIGTCLITSKQNIPCIVIRGKGRGANSFTVSSKFATFLYHLWITYKIDVLIKVYSRKCLDEIDPQGCKPLADIVAKMNERAHEVSSMARALHAAYCHVSRSAVGGLLAVV